MSSQGGVGRREVAWRIFAAEYDGSSLEHSDSDEERAPNYVVTPTGARINRLFVVGVLTEIEQVGDEVLRARIVDPTGGFVVYAGQYQPDALAFLERAEAPMFVAVTGKARTFKPEDSDQIYTSIRPESMNTVDAETRDRWTVQTAQQTLDRVRTFASALDSDQRGETLRQSLEAADVDDGLAAGVPLALDHYRTSTPYLAALQDVALDAARVVAGQQDEVGTLDASPDEPGDATLDVDVSLETPAVETETGTESTTEFDAGASNSETTADSEFDGESTFEPETEPSAEAESTATESETEFESEPETTESGTETTVPDADPEPETPPAQAREAQEVEAPAEPEQTDGESADTESTEPEPVGEAGVEEFDTGDTGVEPADEPGDELGDFDSATSDDDDDDGLGDFDDQPMGEDVSGDMYEFDEGEREQIEEEFGTEFTTGAEVDAPGEADIETPEPAQEMTAESESEPDADTAAEPAEAAGPDTGAAEPEQTEATEPEPTPSEADESESEPESADESSEKSAPENLENTVMEVMRDMNDGDGVEGERLMANVVDSYDVTPADVEGALQDALMAGRCYESGEDTLKPI